MAQSGKGASGCNDGGQDRSRWLGAYRPVDTQQETLFGISQYRWKVGSLGFSASLKPIGVVPCMNRELELEVQDCLVGRCKTCLSGGCSSGMEFSELQRNCSWLQ